MLTSAASALVCADTTAESAIPVVIELSVRAAKALATAAASKSASTIPPSAGNAALANCCVPVARFTTAAYPCPLTYGACASTRAAPNVRLNAPMATTPMPFMVRCPPRQRLSRRHDACTLVRHSLGGALVQLDVAARQRAFSMVHIGTADHVETDEVPAAARLAGVTRFRGEIERAVGRSLILELCLPRAGPDAAIGVRVLVVSDGRLVKRETAERAGRRVGCAVEAMLHPLDMALIGARVQAECGKVAAAVELAAARDPAVVFVLHRELRPPRGRRTRRLLAREGEERGGQQAGEQLHND